MDNESNASLQCRVCLRKEGALYAVADCAHRFCLQCSVAYITSQSNNFASARCLQQGCGQPLNKNLPIYAQLSSETILKLREFQMFQFLQKNHNYKSCKITNCRGIFEIKGGKCQHCQTLHCQKCFQLYHEGKCTEGKQQTEMRNLNYRRCPKCRIWIQKMEGCQFIHCKCGTQFCFTCGNQFRNDPCRMKELWEKQAQMRAMMYEMSLKCPSSVKQLVLLLAKLLLFFLVSFVAFVITCILFITASFLFIGLVALFVPFALCQPISQLRSSGCRLLSNLLFVMGYPLLVGLVGVLMLALILLYPFCKNCNHHGVYDPFNKGLVIAASIYLKMARYILFSQQQ